MLQQSLALVHLHRSLNNSLIRNMLLQQQSIAIAAPRITHQLVLAALVERIVRYAITRRRAVEVER